MALFEWKPIYSVKVATIDAQHQKLIGFMNAFYEAHQTSAYALAKKHLGSLLTYTREHFAEEEQMMAQAAYPDLASHKELHTRLLASVSKLSEEYLKEPSPERGERLANFLKGWLSGHILGVDKTYSPHLLKKGLH